MEDNEDDEDEDEDEDEATTTISRVPKTLQAGSDECCKCPAAAMKKKNERGGRNFLEDSENSIETEVDATTLKMSTTTTMMLTSDPTTLTSELEASLDLIDSDSKFLKNF